MSTYEQILETAYRQFAELGYEKASLSLIAKEIGISKPALYHHFESKESLFETLYDVVISEIIADFHTEISSWSKEVYIHQLIEIGLEDIRYLKQHPQLGNILKQYYLLSMRQESLRQKTQSLEETTIDYYRSLIDHGVKLGIFRMEEAEAITETFHAQLTGISWSMITRPEGSYEASWQLFIKKLLGLSE